MALDAKFFDFWPDYWQEQERIYTEILGGVMFAREEAIANAEKQKSWTLSDWAEAERKDRAELERLKAVPYEDLSNEDKAYLPYLERHLEYVQLPQQHALADLVRGCDLEADSEGP